MTALVNPRIIFTKIPTSSRLSYSVGLNIHRNFHINNKLNQSIKNPYETLGVSSNATQSEIKKAYYKLAKKYHPDINKEPTAEKKFHDLQNAYEILSDEDKRRQYDQFGSAAFDGGFSSPGSANAGFTNNFAGGNPFGSFGGINFEDLFGAAFNSARGNPFQQQQYQQSQSQMYRQYKGDTIQIVHRLNFKDAVFGVSNVNVRFNAIDPCNSCKGSGLKPNTQRHTCHSCNGTGTQIHSRAGFQMMSTCTDCHGEGTKVDPKDYCSHCHGNGVTYNRDKTIKVDFPSGLQDGDVIRVPGKGSYPEMALDKSLNPNVDMLRGDILINIKVDRDPKFTVKNKYDIWYQMDIPITTAALGGTITVPTVDGSNIRLKVAPGTQDGDIITIPNMGVPRNNNRSIRGNMKVQYKIHIKKPTSQVEKCLWEALADATSDTTAKRTMKDTMETAFKSTNIKDTTDFEGKRNQNTTAGDNNNSSNTTNINSSSPDDTKTLGKLENFIINAFKKIKGDNSK